MIRLGYVGSNTFLPSSSKTFRLANYSEEKMLQISRSNLEALEQILDWNKTHNITFFRITSNLIPFGSNPVNSGIWKKVLKKDFERIGSIIRKNLTRVSMHPGQYTVINTPDKLTLTNSLNDLEYHTSVLELMKLNYDAKIVIHGGGAYNDKAESLKRLEQRLHSLPSRIRNRIILENDERVFTAEDIYFVSKRTRIPGVFDIFHHQVLPSFDKHTLREIIMYYNETWHGRRQKIHYSDQAAGKSKGAHSDTINISKFGRFYSSIKDLELDIMLEVKDKQVSLLKIRTQFPELS